MSWYQMTARRRPSVKGLLVLATIWLLIGLVMTEARPRVVDAFQAETTDPTTSVGSPSSPTLTVNEQLSTDDAKSSNAPTGVLSAGLTHNCALRPDGSVDCRGDNERGSSSGKGDLGAAATDFAVSSTPQDTNWSEIGSGSASGGGISNDERASEFPSVAIGPDGHPVVAWSSSVFAQDSQEIYVRHWDGDAWVELGVGSATGGGISNDVAISSNPSLAIDSDGHPVVAWASYDSTSDISNIYVRRWNGTAWVELGAGSATGDGISNDQGFSNRQIH